MKAQDCLPSKYDLKICCNGTAKEDLGTANGLIAGRKIASSYKKDTEE